MIPKLGDIVVVTLTGKVKGIEEWPDGGVRVKLDGDKFFAVVDTKYIQEVKDGKRIDS
jgi:hypothetical protein